MSQRLLATAAAPAGTLDAALSWYRANTSAQHFAGAGRPLSDSEQRRQLLPMPVMGVWSSRDSALLEPQMTASSSFVAPGRWRYHRLEGVGHWVAIEAAQQLNELLLAFLADTAADVSGGQPRPKL
jgi:pimeloyl-ACP methyl ester carboxylesterase